jgi:hypothetical protein
MFSPLQLSIRFQYLVSIKANRCYKRYLKYQVRLAIPSPESLRGDLQFPCNDSVKPGSLKG